MPKTRYRNILPLRLMLTIGSLLLGLSALSAWADPIPEPPQQPVRSYILQDFNSGQILAELNSDERMAPASITKLMSGYVIYQYLRQGHITSADEVTISEKAWRMRGSRMFIEVNSQVSVENLLLGMVVQSGNDATVALAEHVAGSESTFSDLMNQEAAKLGLKNTHFVNSTGWPDPNHYMSARDIAILLRAIIKEFPDYYAQYAIRNFTYNNIEQHNRNRLLWRDSSVDGAKTGHTSSAGYCLSASAKRGNMRLITVVLGAEKEQDRFSASQGLLNYGFRFFESHKLYNGNEPLTEVTIWKGELDQISAGLKEDFYVTIPRTDAEGVSANLSVDTVIEAPINKGQTVGRVTGSLNDEIINEAPLVAFQEAAEGGWMNRLVDELTLKILSLFE